MNKPFNNRPPKPVRNPRQIRRSELVDYLETQTTPTSINQLCTLFDLPRKNVSARMSYLKIQGKVRCLKACPMPSDEVWMIADNVPSEPKVSLQSFNGCTILAAMQQHTLLLLTGKVENETVSN